MLLASGARPFTAASGEPLAREGEAAKTFYLIQAGHVALDLHTPERGAFPIQTVGPGEVVGWSWLVPPHRWHFTCTASEPVSGLMFDAEWLRDRCEQNHELGYHLLREMIGSLAGQLVATQEQLASPQPV